MLNIADSRRREPVAGRFALFDYGFRPFFLLAGLYAVLVIPIWLYFFAHRAVPFGALPAMYWHSHELLYGFVVAAISGFMLTAVPSWTGTRGFGGAPLIALVGLWLLGRLAMATVGQVPFFITALAELLFLPALAALLIPPLLRSQTRNTPLLIVLAALWLSDFAFVLALGSGDSALAEHAIRLTINLALLLVTVIGGRIVPAFTANALRMRGQTTELVTRPWVEKVVIGAMVANVLVDLLLPNGRLSGVLAAFAAVAQAVRLSGWRSFRTIPEPIVWILHAGYAWLPIGFALKASWLLTGAAWALKWQHAFTMGVLATMILAVMTRAALGHTGGPLGGAGAVEVAYVVLTLGVLVRVFGVVIAPASYLLTVSIAGLAWLLCFLIYVIVYVPILAGPRADGKPG